MMHNTANRRTTRRQSARRPLTRGPQPGWMTLNDARERAFTGEIVFEIEPEVRAYLDNGVAYYAERATDAPLGQRLVEAGLVDHGQLERGTVRVGDVEHLGRLFDRDTSVDRDAVLVVTESETEVLVAEIANESFCTVRSTAYRHHPSGLHRWFVTPLDGRRPIVVSAGSPRSRPASLDDIPGLPIVTERPLADQLYIEWDEPIIGGARWPPTSRSSRSSTTRCCRRCSTSRSMHYDIIEFDDVADMDQAAEFSTIEIEYVDVEDFESRTSTSTSSRLRRARVRCSRLRCRAVRRGVHGAGIRGRTDCRRVGCRRRDRRVRRDRCARRDRRTHAIAVERRCRCADR